MEYESETSADDLAVRVVFEVSGHQTEDGRTSAEIEREQEARRVAVEDDDDGA